jgi:hypothetical protein
MTSQPNRCRIVRLPTRCQTVLFAIRATSESGWEGIIGGVAEWT